jgi:SAM-dependent methyltransferase
MVNELNTHGINLPLVDWLDLNRTAVGNDRLMKEVAPFPPSELMHVVSGLTDQAAFALHGATIFEALQSASPRPLADFHDILDFGCGCGRLARLFKGFRGNLLGCDVDARAIDWINQNLTYMRGIQTLPDQPLPFEDGQFDCVVSVSVFSHLSEASQDLYLAELARCTRPGGSLLLTVHGKRALERAVSEERILAMLEIPRDGLLTAQRGMSEGMHNFIVQEQGHLTTSDYKYGIAFVPDDYLRAHWGRYFHIDSILHGAIHDFQSIVVCRRSEHL